MCKTLVYTSQDIRRCFVRRGFWILDVVFKEDDSKVRKNNGAVNQSMLKKIALNILKLEKVTEKKTSLKLKRYKASLNEEFLENIIAGI